jgi:hypothetical protein
MGKHNQEYIIILDIEKVFSVREFTIVQQASAGPPPGGKFIMD